jgi:hypothetical protein
MSMVTPRDYLFFNMNQRPFPQKPGPKVLDISYPNEPLT